MRQNLKRYQDSAFLFFLVFLNIPCIWDNHCVLMDAENVDYRIKL